MRIVPGSRRPCTATEAFVIADALRRNRSLEFALPHHLALFEVRVLYFLRNHGDFVARKGGAQQAADCIIGTVEAIRDLCTMPVAANSQRQVCVLSDEQIMQLLDLRVTTEVDLYKVISDIDLKLGSETRVHSLLALLEQMQ